MVSATEYRRADLRERLVSIAEARLAEGGPARLKARDLAAEAGCALGGIYTIFADLDAVVLAVNARTFARLGQAVAASLDGAGALPPADRMIRMAHAYLDFAQGNARLWRSLFDVAVTVETVPEWYRDALERLLANIAGPVGELYPELDGAGRVRMARALFSAVHGIVLLGLENRVSGVPRAELRQILTEFLTRLA